MGYLVNQGVATPAKTVTAFADGHIQQQLALIARQLFKIKHWKIIHDDYFNYGNVLATWFIDPPYQKGGQYYYHNKIDYELLSKWCLERNGFVIVCENTGANWLPFKPMVNMRGSSKCTTEAIWCNERTSYDYEQTKAF